MLKKSLQVLAGVVLLGVIVVIGLGLFLSRGKTLEQWHEPSTFDESFDYASGSFEDFMAYSDRRLRASRIDSPSTETLSNLMPFRLEPDADCPKNADGRYPNGLVLVHGLIASPWSMKPFGEYYQSHCFYVLGVLLPDHGSRPGDMLDSTWEDWLQSVDFATRILSGNVDNVYLSGHSAGGTLSVLEATRNPAVDGLILFAPAMQVAEASKYAGYLQPLGSLFPKAAWFELEPEEGVYRYESFPFSAAAETWDLIQTTQQALETNPLQVPVMTVASAQDTTVNTQATLDFMMNQEHPLSFTLLYSQNALPPYARTQVVNSSLPEQGILGLGHLGLMTPPDHPHYGRDGDYRYCGQYFGRPNDIYAQCKSGQRDFYGEATEENQQAGIIERIAFNPFYDEMLEEIDLFLEQVGMDRMGLPLQRDIEGANPLELE